MGQKKKDLSDFLSLSDCHCHDLTDLKPHTLDYSSAPHYLKFNPYITGGYRDCTQLTECVRSTLNWNNETINIWTHLIGWVVFVSLTISVIVVDGKSGWDLVVELFILGCFQACMLLSSCYHTFCCTSDLSYRRWLSADLLGVSLALLAIYVSGIYFAFKCDQWWLHFYLSTVVVIFLVALVAQLRNTSEEGFQWRLVLFGAWAAYGVVPTVHWVLKSDFDDGVISLLTSITTMYALSTLAFLFYITRIPERFFQGKVNHIGSSHQIWHVLIFVALFYWYGVCRGEVRNQCFS